MEHLGKNIGCLITTLFYVLMPEFIQEGRLCWLQAPLFKLEKNGKKVFAYNQQELDEFKENHKDWNQSRLKGLGELKPEDVAESMLHPQNRRLEVMEIEDWEDFAASINMLMGEDVGSRQQFMFDNVDFSKLNS